MTDHTTRAGRSRNCFEPSHPDPALEGNGAVAAVAMDLSGLSILVVDDDCGAADTLAKLFELHGANVMSANSGIGALDLLRAYAFDVVVSDLGMPGMDGYEFAAAAKALTRHPPPLLLALSGYTLPQAVRRGIDAGFDAHLRKPFSIQALADALTAHRSRGFTRDGRR